MQDAHINSVVNASPRNGMASFGDASARILGSGASFPSCRTPDGDMVSSIATSDLLERLTPDLPADRRAPVLAHFEEEFGIQRRSWAHWPGRPFDDHEEEEDAATLAIEAGRAALSDGGLAPSQLGFVVVATSTSPRWTAATSALVAGGLGAPCAFLDVRSGCAGGLYALAIGATLAAASKMPVLVVGSDTFSKVTPASERLAVMTAGDGAGALLLGRSSEAGEGLGAAAFGGDGKNHDLATVPGRLPPRDGTATSWVLAGDPVEFSRRIEAALSQALERALARSLGPPSLTLIHSAQRATSRRLFTAASTPGRLFTSTLERRGNLGAASVLVAMHEARAEGLLTRGARLAIASAGGGPSWGGATWTVC